MTWVQTAAAAALAAYKREAETGADVAAPAMDRWLTARADAGMPIDVTRYGDVESLYEIAEQDAGGHDDPRRDDDPCPFCPPGSHTRAEHGYDPDKED